MMSNLDESCGPQAPPVLPTPPVAQALPLGLLAGAALNACGGGGGGGGGDGGAAVPPPPPVAPPGLPAADITAARAARFLAQASMGITRALIARVQALGYEGWIDEQLAMPASETRWDWLMRKGYDHPKYNGTEDGIDACLWRKLMAAPDTLRQRMTLALSEILVVSLNGLVGTPWLTFSVAAYLDMLEANAFGNYRVLLEKVTRSPAMGEFLSYRGSGMMDANGKTMPDENYAREFLQLFTIGLVDLDLDGSPKRLAGAMQESFTLADVAGLARVFTGWDYDDAGNGMNQPDFKRRPMRQIPAQHESGDKRFLGIRIGAGTDGMASLGLALDAVFAHPNVAPFISRQLIQRLVCSNPSPAYVRRVATVFNRDAGGVKGNLQAVLKAILLDGEARDDVFTGNPGFGKLREPILRLTAWGHAFAAASPSGDWAIGNTSDPATSFGQSPMRAPTVFNFFQPDFIAPNSASGQAGLAAPELQITNETSVIGYVNSVQALVSRGAGDVAANYSALLPLAASAPLLIDEINLLLSAGQLSAPTVALIRGTLESMPAATDQERLNRIYAALTLVMASPEFIVQK